ncbi:hypothetical protein M9H77_13089 [Catharanthus roseus]|uniref:Uncharacterized protein n=1 Tax=Catharanthus roseus TaxID=4058 RepID=A0ACC0BJ57_CATRO|nr:hypothetical protein M9H77_13089 [Catharanthus roseus]
MKKHDENSQLEMLEGAKSIGAGAATIALAGAAVEEGEFLVEENEQEKEVLNQISNIASNKYQFKKKRSITRHANMNISIPSSTAAMDSNVLNQRGHPNIMWPRETEEPKVAVKAEKPEIK